MKEITILHGSGYIKCFNSSFDMTKSFNIKFTTLCEKFNTWTKNGCLLKEWTPKDIKLEFNQLANTVNAVIKFEHQL